MPNQSLGNISHVSHMNTFVIIAGEECQFESQGGISGEANDQPAVREYGSTETQTGGG